MKYAQELFDLVDNNRDILNPWMPWDPLSKTVDDIKKFIEGTLEWHKKKESMTFAIMYENSIVGVIGFNTIDSNLKKAILGYWLSKEYNGKGIMRKSCQRLIEYAFDALDVKKVEAYVANKNKKSRRVCENLGFNLEGIITNAQVLNGEIVDDAVYGIHSSN